MPDDLRIHTIAPEGERELDEGWDCLPHGIGTLKLFLDAPQDLDLKRLWVRPLHRPANPHLIVGHEDDGDDLWLSWGGGDKRGYHLDYDRGERFVYFQVAHRTEAAATAYPVTLVVEDAQGELGRATVQLCFPSGGVDPVCPRWRQLDGNGSEIKFAGSHVAEYRSRWWPTRRVTYRPVNSLPNLHIVYRRVVADPFGAVDVFLDDRLVAQVTGRLEVALHDLRLFSADLFHFHSERYWVLRLWFQWLHTIFSPDDLLAFYPQRSRALEERAAADAHILNALLAQDRAGEEVPDAERFDLLIDAEAGTVKYVGTDLHWQELWGPAEGLVPVRAEITSFRLPNIVYGLVTYVEGTPERLQRGETYDPSQVLRQVAEQGFPTERLLRPSRTLSLPAPPQCHVPRVEGLSFRDELTSGHVKKGRTPAGALPFFELEPAPVTEKARWTVMVYLAGDNGSLIGASLQAAGYADLEEMKSVGSTDHVHIVAQFDTLADQRTYRYYLQRDTDLAADVVTVLEETNAGDPSNLVDFVAWATRTYPAERYLLVLWNHGNGWDDTDVYEAFRSTGTPGVRITKAETLVLTAQQRFGRAVFRTTLEGIPPEILETGDRGILYDDTSMDFLDCVELKEALARACEAAGVPSIDVLGMDACLMAMLEVAYQVRWHCGYLVGSEEVEPGEGWPYDRVLRRLTAQPDMAPDELARLVVSEYLAAYDSGVTSPDVTQSALALSRMDELSRAVGELAGTLLGRLHERPVFEAVALARGRAQTFRRKEDYVDLRHFVKLLRDGLASEPEIVAAADGVLRECEPGRAVAAAGYLGAGLVEAGGATIYFPRQGCAPEAGLTQIYRRLDFAQGEGGRRWLDFLLNYNNVWWAYSQGRSLPPYRPGS